MSPLPGSSWSASLTSYSQRPVAVAVHKYTYAHGARANRVFFYSPRLQSPPLNNEPDPGIVLRQTNSAAENAAWIDRDETKFRRCEAPENEELYQDAHGLISCDGWARPIGQDATASTLPFRHGDRVWVEQSLQPGQEVNDEIPVINLDTLQGIMIPYKLITFAPELIKEDSSGTSLAIAVGPVKLAMSNQHATVWSQLFFTWPGKPPYKSSPTWNWSAARSTGSLDGYRTLTDIDEQQTLFWIQWQETCARTRRLGVWNGAAPDSLSLMDLDDEEPLDPPPGSPSEAVSPKKLVPVRPGADEA